MRAESYSTQLYRRIATPGYQPLEAEIKEWFVNWYSDEVNEQPIHYSNAIKQDETTCCSLAGWCP